MMIGGYSVTNLRNMGSSAGARRDDGRPGASQGREKG